MSASTTRLGLTKPGGGSHGTITPGDPVDIDVINDNMDKLDADMGLPSFTSTTRPSAPYAGQAIYETDTKAIAIFAGGSWVYPAVRNFSNGLPFESAGNPTITVAIDGSTTIAHSLPGVPNVSITPESHPTLDANSQFFEPILFGTPTATTFAVRLIDRRVPGWSTTAQSVRFMWRATLTS